MWPRRSQAPPAAAAAATSRPVAPTPTPTRTTAVKPLPAVSDDCGWLMRAVATKKKKKTTTMKTTSAAQSGSSAATGKISKKRSLAGKDSTAGSNAPKLPRGVGWSQPTKAPTPATKRPARRHECEPTSSLSTETFDDVFAEIYGASKRATPAALDDDAPSLPLNTHVFLPDSVDHANDLQHGWAQSARKSESVQIAPRNLAPRTLQDKWEFAAPSAIQLDAFDSSSSAGAKPDRDAKRGDDAVFAQWKDEQMSHAVSDNFVRLNMRKRFKGSSGKAKKQPAYLRTRGFVDADEKAQLQQKAEAKMGVARPGGGGLLDDGIDFIEECLELLKRNETQPAGEGHGAASAASLPEPAEIEPPRCQHALSCQRVLVKNKNKNHGRAFFSCPLGYDEGRCDYFLWEENHAQFALQRLFTTPTSILAGDADGDGLAEEDPTAKYIPLDVSQPMQQQAKAMLSNLRIVFGHSEFRPGQQWAIERVFQKKQTLLVLPTGAGKSLCYQYPALFLPGITIVISPLISLMNDQFHNLPPVLKKHATCVTTSTSSSKAQYAEFVRDLLGGQLRLLFVSPEKALTSGFQRLLSQIRISLVCVDEAHCISEWSHHFRPSYLRLEKLFALADSVLAITATASRRVERDILTQLSKTASGGDEPAEDHGGKSVLRMPWQRDNLRLRVVRVATDDERLEKLCRVLTESNVTGAVIMYVHQQWQAEAMANLLQERLALDADGKSKTKWAKHKIAAYHAKMDAETKEKVRLGFLNGRIKLVIATIAFGMGIDKQNVRLVLHYHVPSSIEHYLQQVGRAGRDGRAASALLFLLDDDVRAFRSLLFSNALHVSQLQRLVELVASTTGTDPSSRDFAHQNMVRLHTQQSKQLPVARCSRLWMHVASLEQYLDMKSAMVETFLTLLSLDESIQDELQISLHPTAMGWCVISMMESQLKSAHADPLLKRLVGSVVNNDPTDSRGHVGVEVDGYLRHLRVHFHVASLASELCGPVDYGHSATEVDDQTVDIQSRRLMQSVRAWQAKGFIRKFQMERTAFDLSVKWVGGLEAQAEEELERRHKCVVKWTGQLYDRHAELETMEIQRLRHLYLALSCSASTLPLDVESESEEDGDDGGDGGRTLEHRLSEYFDQAQANVPVDVIDDDAPWRALTTPLTADLVEAVEHDIAALTSRPPGAVVEENEDPTPHTPGASTAAAWHAYNVARIFHGLASPCFPSRQWRDQFWWRKYNNVAFEKLVVIAAKVLQAQHA